MKRFWESGSGHNGACPHMRKMLRLLSDELSLEVLWELSQAPKDVTAVAEAVELDPPAISRKLKHMHRFSIVEVKRERQRHIYSLGRGLEVTRIGSVVEVKARTLDGGQVVLSLPVPRKHL